MMTELIIMGGVGMVCGFILGSSIQNRECQVYHDKKTLCMAEQCERIIKGQAEAHRLRIQKLKSQLESVAKRCGVELPKDA